MGTVLRAQRLPCPVSAAVGTSFCFRRPGNEKSSSEFSAPPLRGSRAGSRKLKLKFRGACPARPQPRGQPRWAPHRRPAREGCTGAGRAGPPECDRPAPAVPPRPHPQRGGHGAVLPGERDNQPTPRKQSGQAAARIASLVGEEGGREVRPFLCFPRPPGLRPGGRPRPGPRGRRTRLGRSGPGCGSASAGLHARPAREVPRGRDSLKLTQPASCLAGF